jgi:hypothetical protein
VKAARVHEVVAVRDVAAVRILGKDLEALAAAQRASAVRLKL